MNKQELIDALIKADNSRDRSKQKAIGVSSLGDCRRKVWHMAQGHTGNNPTLRLPAILGTAIHAQIEQVIGSEGALIEHRVELEGYPPATIDYFKDGEVVDWKTITLKNIPYFVSKQKIWQVQTYGYLLHLSGVEVHTVTLVGIPRDGTENDIVVHSEPFNPAIGQEALEWLGRVEAATEAPEPEREGKFCESYCPFYKDKCHGIPKDYSGEAISDDVKAQAAKDYVELSAKIKELEALQGAAKAELEGVSGVTFDGITVKWSEVRGRETVDVDQAKALFGSLPMKQGSPSYRLSVK